MFIGADVPLYSAMRTLRVACPRRPLQQSQDSTCDTVTGNPPGLTWSTLNTAGMRTHGGAGAGSATLRTETTIKALVMALTNIVSVSPSSRVTRTHVSFM